MENIAKKLKLLRTKKGVMQKDIAEEIGITPTSYSYYENAKRYPSADVLKKLAEYHNVPVDYFFEDDDSNLFKMGDCWGYIDEFKKIINQSNYIKYSDNTYDDLNNVHNWKNISDYNIDYNHSDIAVAKIEVKEQDIPFSPISRGWIETPKEINPKVLHEALDTLLIYANKCSIPKLTDSQLDMIFDKTVDYIKYQLYQLNRE